jgi:hypothetical protein
MFNRSEASIFSEGRRYYYSFAVLALSASLLVAVVLLMGLVAGAAQGQTVEDNAIGVQLGEDNVQCVQNASIEQANAAASQYQDGDITQVNVGLISQKCDISVTEVKKILTFLAKKGVISDDGKKFVVDDGKKFVVDGKDGKDDAAHDQYGDDDGAAHDQYDGDAKDGDDVITTPKEAKEGVISDTIPKGKKVLPDTGGGGGMFVSLPALGLLTLIVGGAASGLVLVRRR